jgi:hypothetical protein
MVVAGAFGAVVSLVVAPIVMVALLAVGAASGPCPATAANAPRLSTAPAPTTADTVLIRTVVFEVVLAMVVIVAPHLFGTGPRRRGGGYLQVTPVKGTFLQAT